MVQTEATDVGNAPELAAQGPWKVLPTDGGQNIAPVEEAHLCSVEAFLLIMKSMTV